VAEVVLDRLVGFYKMAPQQQIETVALENNLILQEHCFRMLVAVVAERGHLAQPVLDVQEAVMVVQAMVMAVLLLQTLAPAVAVQGQLIPVDQVVQAALE
jgi:hypothetical protein